MLKWTLRSSSGGSGRRTSARAPATDMRDHRLPAGTARLRDSNKCWSETQVKVAQVKSTLKLTKENECERRHTADNGDSLECSSDYSSSKTSRSSVKSSKSSSADPKEERRRKKLSKSVRCATLDPLGLFSGAASDSDSGSAYMQLQRTPAALLTQALASTGHEDPRRRPLVDLSNGDYSDVTKHLQSVYLKHPWSDACHPTMVTISGSQSPTADPMCGAATCADATNGIVLHPKVSMKEEGQERTEEEMSSAPSGSTPDVVGCHKTGPAVEAASAETVSQESVRERKQHDLKCEAVSSAAGEERCGHSEKMRCPDSQGACNSALPSEAEQRESERSLGESMVVCSSRRSLRSGLSGSKMSRLKQFCDIGNLSGKTDERRLEPEGTGLSKQDTPSEINKRHSIAVLPKALPRCSFKKKKRCSSQTREKESILKRCIVDIHLDEGADSRVVQPLVRESHSPPNTRGFRQCLHSATEETSLQNAQCNETKSNVFQRHSLVDNALYMTMKDTHSSQGSSDINNKKDEPIYSTPKLATDGSKAFTCATDMENFEKNIYVKMCDCDAPHELNSKLANVISDSELVSPKSKNLYSLPVQRNEILVQNSTDTSAHRPLYEGLGQLHDGSAGENQSTPHSSSPPQPPLTSPCRRIINRQISRNAAKDVGRPQPCQVPAKATTRLSDVGRQADPAPTRASLLHSLPSPCGRAESHVDCRPALGMDLSESNFYIKNALDQGLLNFKVTSKHNNRTVGEHYGRDELPNRTSVSLPATPSKYFDVPAPHTRTIACTTTEDTCKSSRTTTTLVNTNRSSRKSNMSVLLGEVVHRNLFDTDVSWTELRDCDAATALSRRHSISAFSELPRENAKLSSRENVDFWNNVSDTSVFLPKIRRTSSESMLCEQVDVPLASAVAKVLCHTQYSFLSISRSENQAACTDHVVSVGQSMENQIRHVLGRRKNEKMVTPETMTPGKQVSVSQRLKTSSGADLFPASPCNMTLQLPDSGCEKQPTHIVVEAVSVPAVVPCCEEGCRSCVVDLSLTGAPQPALKAFDKIAQRQAESSYRLSRLLQNQSLDCEVESDSENWDSGEWSMLATLDENSSRDPAVLDASVFCSNDVMKDFQALDSTAAGVINKLKILSDDKMLAKFRKSFRRKDKDKIDPKSGKTFMFVDNPMYLSPEIKKEAKVISSGGCGSSLFFSNPTYSSPEITKSYVRSYTRPRSDPTQCEKENFKNLILAQTSSEPSLHREMISNATMQCNPCYQCPKPARASGCAARPDTLPGLALSQEEINGDNILEHEYCTIPGDESDSWVTQSSGSQQTNSSPSSKRHLRHSLSSLCLSSPQSRGRFVLSCKHSQSPQPEVEKAPKSSHIYANEPPVVPRKGANKPGLSCSSSYASPRTPRPVRRSCLTREQFVFDDKPPAVPPPLPSRLRDTLRVASSCTASSGSNSEPRVRRSSSNRARPTPEDVHGYQIYSSNCRVLKRDSNENEIHLHPFSGQMNPLSSNFVFELPPDGVYESIKDATTANTRTAPNQPEDELKNRLSSEEPKISERQKEPSLSSESACHSSGSSKSGCDTEPVSNAKLSNARTPKTPARRCARPSFLTTPGAAKNAIPSLGRGRRTPSRRPQKKYRARDVLEGKGLLQLAAYENSGLLTIHIIEARKLKSRSSGVCNPYVKLSLVPDEVERTFCRTSVLRNTNCPRFDQQFSFDFLPEDLDKRLLISLWNRDPLKKRSEFLGCMSFNVGHILSKRVQGWFRLLTETVGRRKHFAAPPPSPRRLAGHPRQDAAQEETGTPTAPRRHHQVTDTGAPEGLREEGWGAPPAPAGLTPYTLTVRVPRGPRGFGFSVSWSRPPRVERVDAGGPAAGAGLLPGDYILYVGGCSVGGLGERGVMAAIRDCGEELPLEVYRKGAPPGLPHPSSSRRSLFPHNPTVPQPTPASQLSADAESATSVGRRWHSAADRQTYYSCVLQRHAQLYPAILASPTRHHTRFLQVTGPVAAVLQV